MYIIVQTNIRLFTEFTFVFLPFKNGIKHHCNLNVIVHGVTNKLTGFQQLSFSSRRCFLLCICTTENNVSGAGIKIFID